MFNREYHVRAKRQGRRRSKLQGEQLDITFPRRGRPSRIRRLERAGQMRLTLRPGRETKPAAPETKAQPGETLDEAIQMFWPVRPPTEDELMAEFCRMFPSD